MTDDTGRTSGSFVTRNAPGTISTEWSRGASNHRTPVVGAPFRILRFSKWRCFFPDELSKPSVPVTHLIPSVRRGARSDLSGQAPQKSSQTVQPVPVTVARIAVLWNNAGFIPTFEPASPKKNPSPQIFSKIPKNTLQTKKYIEGRLPITQTIQILSSLG